ncbi:hypothetical protein PG996_012376 [Apiospora saccharicola]|uniref:Cytochrome P450 n=1 Tax=Apiospora saccharicola TaxID=335842 RepID=A0ABR1U4S6_9PEZI
MENSSASPIPRFLPSYLVVGTLFVVLLRYLIARYSYDDIREKTERDHRPPLLPHAIPLLGHILFDFLRDPLQFALTSPIFWQRQPVRLKALFQEVCIIQGAQNIVALFKQRGLSTRFIHHIFLSNVFLLPNEAAEICRRDDSGEYFKPRAGSTVHHHNRIDFHSRVIQNRLLLGPGQSALFGRLSSNMTKRLSCLPINTDWTEISDLMDVFKSDLTAATIDALAGPALVQRHPSFARDIWLIDSNITGFILKKPRFMNFQAHEARDRAFQAVLDWRSWASSNFTPEAVDEEGNDPFWGSSFFRERDKMFSNMDGFNAAAKASEDLSFIWSSNTNGIIASFWITVEVFRDSELLHAVREEVSSCIRDGEVRPPSFDIYKLMHQPLLQAVFAETLRLHVHGFLVRHPHEDRVLNRWTIPGGDWCIASSTPAAMDPEFWCTGESASHGVNEFWPARFLRWDSVTNKLTFSLAGTEGSWVPFGGGSHVCPGRFFAKRQNILTLALMVTLYDCELLADQESLDVPPGTYPLGSVSPRGKVPVKMRRRIVV